MAGPSDEKKSLAPPVLRSGLTPPAKPSLTGPSKFFFLRPAPFVRVLCIDFTLKKLYSIRYENIEQVYARAHNRRADAFCPLLFAALAGPC